jgi:hypothetical protein
MRKRCVPTLFFIPPGSFAESAQNLAAGSVPIDIRGQRPGVVEAIRKISKNRV